MGAILNVIAASGGGFTPVTRSYSKIGLLSGSWSSGTVTLNFQNSIGYTIPNGTSITVTNSGVAAWNGTFTVTGGSNTSVQFANATTGSIATNSAPQGLIDVSGSGTETVPTGATSLIIRMYGGGGSGVYTSTANYGAGGGGGAQITSTSLSVSGGQTITYSVGAPGTGTTTAGVAGGNTTVTFTGVFVATAGGGGAGTGAPSPGAGGTVTVTTGTASSSNPGSSGTAGNSTTQGSGGAAGAGGTGGGATATPSGGAAVMGNNLGGGSTGGNITPDASTYQGGAGFISFSYT